MVGCPAKTLVNNIIVLMVELQLKNVTPIVNAKNIVIKKLLVMHSKNSFDCNHNIKKNQQRIAFLNGGRGTAVDKPH